MVREVFIARLQDPSPRLTSASSTTEEVRWRTSPHSTNNVIQLLASAGATGAVTISASLDGVTFPVVETITVSANSKHLIWLEGMPIHYVKVDPSTLTGGTVTVKSSEVVPEPWQ